MMAHFGNFQAQMKQALANHTSTSSTTSRLESLQESGESSTSGSTKLMAEFKAVPKSKTSIYSASIYVKDGEGSYVSKRYPAEWTEEMPTLELVIRHPISGQQIFNAKMTENQIPGVDWSVSRILPFYVSKIGRILFIGRDEEDSDRDVGQRTPGPRDQDGTGTTPKRGPGEKIVEAILESGAPSENELERLYRGQPWFREILWRKTYSTLILKAFNLAQHEVFSMNFLQLVKYKFDAPEACKGLYEVLTPLESFECEDDGEPDTWCRLVGK